MSEALTLDRIEQVEAELINLPQVDCPLRHKFAPGIYVREIYMPAGAFIIGHKHRTEHFNMILAGRAAVLIDDKQHIIRAPDVFISKPGVRKVLLILEDMVWATIHATDITNVEELERILVEPSETFKRHELETLSKIGGIECPL